MLQASLWCCSALASLAAPLGATVAPPPLPTEVDARARSLIAFHAFSSLPEEQRQAIVAAGAAPSVMVCGPDCQPEPWSQLPRLGEDDFLLVRRVASRELWDRMLPVHQHALRDMVVRCAAGEDVPAMCFTPGTDEELIAAFNRVAFGVGLRFQQAGRWSTTATQPGPLSQGQPTILTYSFPPDGTDCPTLTNGVIQPSNLFQYLNGIYGTPETWQPLYAQVFARWSQVCGVDYVYEPNDDGVALGTTAGQLGVRGDLRLAGTGLDGPSGVLAFNYFPNNGDMVIDTADTFFTTTTSNSLRLRNVLAHEHGHGMGMAHVCPTSQTKLMEPFVSVAYDGPQIDDILNGQRHYGDPNEPNDTPATATAITAATSSIQTVRTVSCDDRTDIDVYRVNAPASGLLTVAVRPIGGTYIEGPQTSACNTGGTFYAGGVNDLNITVLAADGTTMLTSAAYAPAGSTETAYLIVQSAGDLFIQISPGTATNIQAYELDYKLQPPPALEIVVPGGAPAVIDPNTFTTFPVRILSIGETIAPGSARLYYRIGSGGSTFVGAPLSSLGGEFYQARLPAPGCAGPLNYYVGVTGQSLGNRAQPTNAPALVFASVASSTTYVRQDSFESANGWVAGAVGDTATAGQWTRGDPNGSTAQPEDDHSNVGAQCFFTGQAAVGAAPGTNDVDGGKTTLVSPVFDLSSLPASPTVAYWRWYSNSGGAAPGADVFTVDVSSDGGANWINLETVGPSGAGTTGGWVLAEFNLTGRIALTNAVQFRFIADDAADASLIEAAIDDFEIRFNTCREVCRGDFNADRRHTVQDIFDYLNAYFSLDPAADYNADAEVSLQDVFVFLNGWFGPCP
jgi:hypothetical protein